MFERFRAWVRSALGRGEDPRREIRYVVPYGEAGVYLTGDQSLSLSTVWACIDVIARAIASCRWNIYQPLPGTNRRALLSDDPKFWMLNTRPNPEMTAIGVREALLFQAIPFGNAYAEIVRDRGGRIIQLWPLPSDRVFPKRDPKTWQLIYEFVQPDGSRVWFQPEQIFHLRGPGMWGLMGDNVIARAAKSIGVAAAQERYSAAFFGQGASPQGVLEFPGKLGDQQHARLKTDWAERHKGPENAHKPLILESGMKWATISIDPQKSQLIEGRQFSVEEICRWFGVPPHKVQHLEHATFSNIEHSSIEFVRDALVPWARRLEQEADAKLFDQTRAPWKYTEIDVRPLTRGDAQSRALAQASWRQNGIMSANEIRADEGLDDCGDDGDVLLVQANMTTVENIMKPPPLALPPGSAAPPGGGDGGDDEDLDLDPDVEPDTDDQAADPSAVARRALVLAMTGSLERLARKFDNRRADMKKKNLPIADIEKAILALGNSQLPRIHDELEPFVELAGVRHDLPAAIELVGAGRTPVEAVAATCPRLA